jgi:hypothetical protein
MNRFRFEDTDYSVLVKQRARPPNPWRWEIYRAGKLSPIGQSPIFFRTMAAAKQSRKNGTQAAIGQAPLPARDNNADSDLSAFAWGQLFKLVAPRGRRRDEIQVTEFEKLGDSP